MNNHNSHKILRDLSVFLFFGFLVVLKFWNLLIPRDKIYLVSDFIELMPMREFFYRQLREGLPVLWDSHLGTGLPYLSADFGAFYPPDLIVGLLGNFYNIDRLQVQMALHFWLAGVFTYGYIRQLGLPRLSAAISGMCFMLGGFLLAHDNHRNIIHTFIWLPLVLTCIDKALAQRKLIWAMTAGLVLSVSFLAGNANFFYYLLLVIGLYCLFRLGSLLREKSWGRALAETGYFLVTGLFCIGFSAVQILPMISSTLGSSQAAASFNWKVQGSFSILHLVSFLTPILWASRDASEDFAYLGLFPLLLGCWVFIPAKEKIVQFFSLVALFGFILALGEHTPLFKIFYDSIPGMNLFRIPGRAVSLIAFALAGLAGFGSHYLIQEARRPEIAALDRFLRAMFFFSLGGGVLAYLVYYLSIAFPIKEAREGLSLWTDWLGRYTFYLLFLGGAVLIVSGRRRSFPLKRLKPALLILIGLDLLIVNLNVGPDLGAGTHRSQKDPALIPALSEVLAGELSKETAPFRISDPENLMVLNAVYQKNYSIYEPDRAPGYVGRFLPPEYHHLAQASLNNPHLLDLLNLKFALRPDQPLWQEKIFPIKLSRQAAETDSAPSQTIEIEAPHPIQTLALNSHLIFGAGIPQGRTVAEVTLFYSDGAREVWPLQAGVGTAEWSIDNPKGEFSHQKPTVADSWPEEAGGYQGHSFSAVIKPLRVEKIKKIEIAYKPAEGLLEIKGISLNHQPVEAFLINRLEPIVPPNLYKNNRALPRVFMIARARAVSKPEEALAEIQKKSFNPREGVILDALPPNYREPGDSGYAPQEARIEAYGPRQIRITTQAGEDKFLVLSDTYSPYWQAAIDGRPARVLRANYGLRALSVPPGRHDVTFVFHYRPFYWGLGLTAATLVVFALTPFISRRRRFSVVPEREVS